VHREPGKFVRVAAIPGEDSTGMSKTPRILVLQHLEVEHPGIFRRFLAEDGIAWDAVELDHGESIPDLDGYAGLWVMGGPMDVWEVSEYPWLVDEMAVIRAAVNDLKLPFLGVCLGHQLLAAALGGKVAKGTAEVGVMTVELTADGRRAPHFADLPATLECLQWHGAEVTALPPQARVLARSEDCAIQAMAVGEHAVSTQFHVEVTTDTVPEWSAVPAYAAALDAVLGTGAVNTFQHEATAAMAGFNRDARIFYDNWMRVAGIK
jgi:GMP synthase-like glutamine amidotransferase